jgi:hypothetical protein
VGDQQARVISCGLRPYGGWRLNRAPRRRATECPLEDPAGPRVVIVVQIHCRGLILVGRWVGLSSLPAQAAPRRWGLRRIDQRFVDRRPLARDASDGRSGVAEPPHPGGQPQSQTEKSVTEGEHTGLSWRGGVHPPASLDFTISGVNGVDQRNGTVQVLD